MKQTPHPSTSSVHDTSYAKEYLERLLNDDRNIEPPDTSRLNGHSGLIKSLLETRERVGVEAARESWETLQHNFPELASPAPEKAAKRTRRLLHATELSKLPPVNWLIPGHIPENSLTLLYGKSGVGKSFFGLDLAMQVAHKHTVVYVAAEGARGYSKRAEAWWKQNQADRFDYELYFLPEAVQLLDKEDLSDFVDLICNHKPTLVVIDTLARCMVGGDENSSRDMGQFIHACDEIRESTGAAVLVVHHTGKDSSAGARGSSALLGACDTAIELTSGDKDNELPTLTVRCTKSKDAAPFKEYFLKFTTVTVLDGQESCVLVPITNPKAKPLVSEKGLKILTAIQQHGSKEGMGYSAIAKATGIPNNTCNETLKKLKHDGFLIQARDGAPYQLTEKGAAYLAS